MHKRSLLENTLKLALAGLSITFIIFYFQSRRGEFLLIFNISLQINCVLLALTVLANLLNALKNLILLMHLGLKNIRFFAWFRIYALSRFINLNLLQTGNIYRCVKLKKAYSFPYTKTISSSVFFVWLEIISIVMISFILIFLSPTQGNLDRAGTLEIIAVIITVLVAAPLVMHELCLRSNFRNEKLAWMNEKLKDLNHYFLTFIKQPKLTTGYFLLTGIVFLTFSQMTSISFSAINRPISFYNAVLFTAILFVTRCVNIVPGNIGVSEVICGYFSEILGGTVGEGIIVSSIIRVVDYIFLAASSLVYIHFNFNEIKQNTAVDDQ